LSNLPKILLVEDNPNDIELLVEVFNDHKLINQVDVAHDGVDALDYLYYKGNYANRKKENPAVILLDIKMPKIDGTEVLRTVKNDESLKDIPVIMFTSSSLDRDIIESYNLGVNAYVIKPVSFNEFIQALKSLGIFWTMLNKTSY